VTGLIIQMSSINEPLGSLLVGSLGLLTGFQPRLCGMELVTLKRLRLLRYEVRRLSSRVAFVLSATGSNLERMCALCEMILKNSAPTSQKRDTSLL
jgi:hypothetical protein